MGTEYRSAITLHMTYIRNVSEQLFATVILKDLKELHFL